MRPAQAFACMQSGGKPRSGRDESNNTEFAGLCGGTAIAEGSGRSVKGPQLEEEWS